MAITLAVGDCARNVETSAERATMTAPARMRSGLSIV
jgi:hypothetical protein